MDDGNSWKIILAKFFTKTINYPTEIANPVHSLATQSDRLLYFLNYVFNFEKWKINQSFGGKLHQYGNSYLHNF